MVEKQDPMIVVPSEQYLTKWVKIGTALSLQPHGFPQLDPPLSLQPCDFPQLDSPISLQPHGFLQLDAPLRLPAA